MRRGFSEGGKKGSIFKSPKNTTNNILIQRTIIRYIPLILLSIVIVIFGLFVPHFLTTRNIINILKQSSVLGLMAMGMTEVLIGGGIDLSIPPIMAFGGIIGSMYMRGGGNPLLACCIIIIVCTLGGAINGYAVAYLKMIPFIVTLSTMYIATGASIWLTRELSIAVLNSAFINTITGKIWIIPVPVVMLFIALLIVYCFMRYSVYGRWLYAVGSNPAVAHSLGIPKDLIIFGTYIFSGLFAGLASIISTARLASASPSMGREVLVLDVIGSSVVGGVSVYGGIGSPLGAVVGAIFITTISNSMNLMHVSYYMTLLVKGSLIIAIVALDTYRKHG